MNKKHPTFFLTWFNKFSQVPYPGMRVKGPHIYMATALGSCVKWPLGPIHTMVIQVERLWD
jgi:hypothetical protein